METVNYEEKKVLIVDDIEEVRESYERGLKYSGLEAKSIANPLEALEYLKANKVDVILLDYYMPEMNGDAFIEKLREFDKSTVIILQTGFSEKLPALEIIDQLNIQGYVNKNEGFEEVLLQVKSALKTASLLKKVDILDYQKEFISNLLVSVTDETKDQVMVLGGQKNAIANIANSQNNDELKDIAETIATSLSKINSTFKALNFTENDDMISNLNRIFEIVKTLTFAKASVVFKTETDGFVPVKCKGSFLVYILSEIVMYLYSNDKEQTEIIGRNVDGKVSILVNKPYEYSNEIIEKIKNIVNSEKNINITVNEEKMIEIIIE